MGPCSHNSLNAARARETYISSTQPALLLFHHPVTDYALRTLEAAAVLPLLRSRLQYSLALKYSPNPFQGLRLNSVPFLKMAKLDCPVPGCQRVGISRKQCHVNDHLRADHGIEIDSGKGGNLKLLHKNQQETFSHWLKANGYDNTTLIPAKPIKSLGNAVQPGDNENEVEGEEDGDEDDEIVLAPPTRKPPKARGNGSPIPPLLAGRKRRSPAGRTTKQTSSNSIMVLTPDVAPTSKPKTWPSVSEDGASESEAEAALEPVSKKRKTRANAELHNAAENLKAMDQRTTELSKQAKGLDQRVQQLFGQSQGELLTLQQLRGQRSQLQAEIRTLETQRMMLHAEAPTLGPQIQGLAPRRPTGLPQAQPAGQLHAAIPTHAQSQAARRGAVIDLTAGEQQGQLSAQGAGTIQARPAENVRRVHFEQLERQLLLAPPTFRPHQSHEESNRQRDQELIIRLQDRAEDEVDGVDEASFDPLEQWQSPRMFPQVAEYGDEMGDDDMFNEPMDLE